jgi:hypothetical protein
VTKKAHFEITALVICAIGVIVIVSGVWGSNDTSEPRRLPRPSLAARPLDAGDGFDRMPVAEQPGSAVADPSIRVVSHQVTIATAAAASLLGAFDPAAPVSIRFTDATGTTPTRPLVENELIRTRIPSFTVSGVLHADIDMQDRRLALRINDGQPMLGATGWRQYSFTPPGLRDGTHHLTLFVVDANDPGNRIQDVGAFSFKVAIRTTNVRVLDVDSSQLSLGMAPYWIRVVFDTEELDGIHANMLKLRRLSDTGVEGAEVSIASVRPQPASAAIELLINEQIAPGTYRLQIVGGNAGVKDQYGNLLEGNDASRVNYETDLVKPVGAELPSIRPGITGSTGPYVAYPEFTASRNVPDGFNPHDKVETRVVRLYYFRDAHRVAQIVNRTVKSYNRAGVDMQRQLADKARNEADQRTAARQEAERAAIIKAQKTREKEHELRGAEQSLNRTIQELTHYRRANPTSAPNQAAEDPMLRQLESLTQTFANRVQELRTQVQTLRDDEVAANELAQRLESQEARAREEQFRREVAAAHADPDTYAPGVPTADDPVRQVSVSVIGEGLIHLRGPLKGVNTIRTMIDQIDQPVGQVRVSVHTVQINGERQERMEDVANIIQRYIDHARFLTMQSSEMLRKAIVQVASRKAEEAMALYPGESQEDRDRRYMHAFFGQDFIRELEVMDSEFLQTGNKLLALHSMDTISLSSALNLLALANNTTRLEIFHEFDRMVQGELPCAEASYLEAGLTAIRRSRLGLRHPPTFYPMAQNARFESLRGFFNMEIGHPDTMTPLQREFVRLAQIFKSRLITELEYRQRVMERAIIEERMGDRIAELEHARNMERQALSDLQEVERQRATAREGLLTALTAALGDLKISDNEAREKFALMRAYEELKKQLQKPRNREDAEKVRQGLMVISDTEFIISETQMEDIPYTLVKGDDDDVSLWIVERDVEEGQPSRLVPLFRKAIRDLAAVSRALDGYGYERTADGFKEAKNQLSDLRAYSNELREGDHRLDYDQVMEAAEVYEALYNSHVELLELIARIDNDFNRFILALTKRDTDLRTILPHWPVLRSRIENYLGNRSAEWKDVNDQRVQSALEPLIRAEATHLLAQQRAQDSRRPLDHKKFLDMLIDDLEEKYIELLDGTRAHTANVDNYLKRLTTALDDDFNTQFYHPAFRYIREASTHWDVQFGQTETTSILANNREFAKVDPSATMEFDLPPRDILFAEALNGAKALMDDVGALANDPTFLAMAKIRTQGSGTSPPPGSTGGFGVVRDVLPGLNSSTAEQIMAHNAGARPQLGSNLENLIPDPAIYKFETGTGFEIRPVIQPDGQAVVFNFNYMYTTNIREPVRADEKHLGRVRRHFIHTDVQLSNFELREVSRYTVALKAARTSRGVPLLEDIPVVGVLWRPLPSSESSLQQNIILSQATIFPTLFDLMGLRWAPVVSDMDPLRVSNREFIVRGRQRALENRVYDYASSQVDEFLRIPEANRRTDLYRSQETIPWIHPNGYQGPGLDLRDSQLQEGYQPERAPPPSGFIPGESREGALFRPGRNFGSPPGTRIESYPLDEAAPERPDPVPIVEPANRIRLP